jgi:DNA-directed RNA polymerase subunit beta'
VDGLNGLKENVILGHMIPSGTGFVDYRDASITKLGEPIEIEEEEDTLPAPSEESIGAHD